jgi:hypothetical protein
MAALNATDKQTLAEANARLKKSYKTIKEYLTDNGKLDVNADSYKRRLTVVENARGKAKDEKFISSTDWSTYISGQYGQYLLDVYNAEPDVAAIIKYAYENDELANDTLKKIQSTKWYLNLQPGEYEYNKGTSTQDKAFLAKVDAKKATIKQEAANNGYTLTDDQLTGLTTDSLKGLWDPATLTKKIGESVVSGAAGGGQVTATAPESKTPTTLQAGSDAASLKALSRAYGLNLSDGDIEGYTQSIVSGNITAQQVKDQFRNQAKSLYPALSSQLDSGTVADATSTYRSIAAKTLGIDGTAIDFTDATKFGKLLTYQDPKSGEHRLMNSTEWTQYLRGLPEWNNTSEAKSQYSGIINTVSKIFGKVG